MIDGSVYTPAQRWSGLNVAIAASKFNTYDAAAMDHTQKEAFTTSRSGSYSYDNGPNGGGGGKARTSFFPTPQSSAKRFHPGDSEDNSSRSATRSANNEANNFVENGEGADENDLELGYAGEWEDRHGEA